MEQHLQELNNKYQTLFNKMENMETKLEKYKNYNHENVLNVTPTENELPKVLEDTYFLYYITHRILMNGILDELLYYNEEI
jgi:predicted nuclease with TOPRIM domain